MADDDTADLLGQRPDALFERLALIGESDFGAVRAAGFGDAPGERTVVRDPHHETAFATHEARIFSHCP